jgi:hypothetical protein
MSDLPYAQYVVRCESHTVRMYAQRTHVIHTYPAFMHTICMYAISRCTECAKTLRTYLCTLYLFGCNMSVTRYCTVLERWLFKIVY